MESLCPEVLHEALLQCDCRRGWQEYADACMVHDRSEPAVVHAAELSAAA